MTFQACNLLETMCSVKSGIQINVILTTLLLDDDAKKSHGTDEMYVFLQSMYRLPWGQNKVTG